jgi:hypothetical protein
MRYYKLGYLLILTLLLGYGVWSVKAGIIFPWSPVERIPAYEINTERGPFTVADNNQTVHAFNSQSLPDGTRAIVYRQWTQSGGWTNPIDIFWDQREYMEMLGIFLDANYTVHIIFILGEDIYYSKSYLLNAGKASSWDSPFPVGRTLSYPYNGSISGNNEGKLVITYGGLEEGSGLYAAYSDSDGNTWTDPINLWPAYNPEDRLSDVRMFYGESGLFHVVWAYYAVSGFGSEGFYSNLDLNTQVWSSPVLLDDAPGTEFPSVIEYNGQIILSYYHRTVNGHWYRYSTDNGDTWSNKVQISDRHRGSNGAVSFVVDGSQTLHLFFAQRTNENIHGVWHSIWMNENWLSQEPVIARPQIRDVIGGSGFDPHSANATIVNGNVVLVTWATDGFAGVNGSWYSYTLLDSQEIATEKIPTPTLQIQATPSPTTAVSVIEQPLPDDRQSLSDVSGEDVGNLGSSFFAVQLSALLVLVALFSIVSGVFIKRNR